MVILIKPIMGVIVMAFFIKFLNFGLILTILFSALVYSISLFTLKAFDKEDYKIIKKLFENEKLPKDI